jgi:hypothetical protein
LYSFLPPPAPVITKEHEATIGITVSCSSRNKPLKPTSLK